MKIAVYYIVTGEYKCYFNDFLKSLKNFFPGTEKHVILMSDTEIEHDKIDNVIIKYRHINHYPWPIITLYKHWHILQNFDESCDYHCYFNANSIVNKNNPDKWCDFSKLNVSYHSFSNKPNILFPSASIIKKESCAYLKEYTYDYIQGGFFFGKTDIVKNFCDGIVDMVNCDSKKQLYATWHDESYANKWVETHKDIVSKKFIMTVYDRFIDETTFIKLPIKNKKIENFKKS